MSNQEAGSLDVWKTERHRDTYYGLDLTLRRNLVSGEIAVIALKPEGVLEIKGKSEVVNDAFSHPVVTPGLEPESMVTEPWDEALDAYNSLSSKEQYAAMNRFNRIRKDGAAAPILLLEAVKRASEKRSLDRAA